MLFSSQLNYGKYGARICTPVASVVASLFVNDQLHKRISAIYSRQVMDHIMTVSHKLYEDTFSSTNANLMLSDVQRFFPSTVDLVEIAGLIDDKLSIECESPKVYQKVDNLILVPLMDLLNYIRKAYLIMDQHKLQRLAFLVTCNEHTVAYLLDTDCTLYKFDSLEASIIDISKSWKDSIQSGSRDAEYSGIILFHKTHAPFVSELFSDIGAKSLELRAQRLQM